MARPVPICLLGLVLAGVAACGGGGGGGGNGGTSNAARTTFTGNLSSAATAVAAAVQAAADDVQVCVEGTSSCTLVDADGVFTLAADVGGDVTLVFTGPDFQARVTLTDVPFGATVRLRNITCSTVTGTCEPEDLEIEGAATRGPIRCQQGPIQIVQASELVIEGHGDDCIRTEGQCEVTIQADRLVLDGCATCVRTAGGSEVAIDVAAGGFVCDAAEDGIRAAGNSAVHVTAGAGGDVDIDAGQVGALSEGTALIEIAGDQCRIAGDDNAVRTNGNADVETGDCAAVDLVGGVGQGGDGDDEGDDDHRNGNGKGKDDSKDDERARCNGCSDLTP